MTKQGALIFALATPPGVSAIAIFRCSGALSHQLGYELSGFSLRHREIRPALLKDETGAALDEAMLLYLKAPHSPTGEDMLEIHCHGSLAVIQGITDYLASRGDCRLARPGEFTQRAFANGKMDLTEIEGLADLIDAQTAAQRLQALSQLRGALRKQAGTWRHDVIALAARVESVIDFADEDLPDDILKAIEAKRQALLDDIDTALGDDARGEIIRDGVMVTIIGPVNAGKSTALNALAGRPAAIVSDEAGTTRDIVEVRLNLSNMAVRLLDTAGIRENAGTVEAIGIERAKAAANEADLVLAIADGGMDNWHAITESLLDEVSAPVLKILNKADLLADNCPHHDYVPLSLQKNSDIDRLEAMLAETIAPLNRAGTAPIITRARHRQLLETCKAALLRSSNLSLSYEPELVGEELRVATNALGQLTGHIDVEDILEDIFSSFCIGK